MKKRPPVAPGDPRLALASFAAEKRFLGKGPLSVALVLTQHAKERGLPLDPGELVTEGGGQVLGLGKGAVQTVLERHGITRVLAQEGGRTSRNSLKNMRAYVDFLNELHGQLQPRRTVDLAAVENFWIERVHAFFAAKPFRIKVDPALGLRKVVRDVVAEAAERQKSSQGVQYVGAVLQHLVGAKLDCALGKGQIAHHGFSTADAPGARAGDFLIEDVAIHVTTAPGEAVIARCRENLDDGLRPMLVTLQRGLTVAEALADNAGLFDRIDIFEIEQFVALNLYEWAKFGAMGRRASVLKLLERYNELIDEHETDPSLKIEFKR